MKVRGLEAGKGQRQRWEAHGMDVFFCRDTEMAQIIIVTEASSSEDRCLEHKDVFLSTHLFYLN